MSQENLSLIAGSVGKVSVLGGLTKESFTEEQHFFFFFKGWIFPRVHPKIYGKKTIKALMDFRNVIPRKRPKPFEWPLQVLRDYKDTFPWLITERWMTLKN